MAFTLWFFAAAIAMACAMPQHHHHEDHHAPAHYKFSYGVHDAHTHDIKNQEEVREGDKVHGSYSLLQPDGRQRIVHYTSDKHNGFNAVVEYKGHAAHPQVHHKVVAVPAVHKYVAPVVAHHVAPVVHHATHHVAPVVHHATHHIAPVVHHVAPVVHHVAPVVAHVPVAHHGATSSVNFVSNHHGHHAHY